MVPGMHLLVTKDLRIAVAIDGGSRNIAGCLRKITRQGAESILECKIGGFDRVLLIRNISYLGVVDQFLAFQNAAQEQSDNDQLNGYLVQGNAGLTLFHEVSLPMINANY